MAPFVGIGIQPAMAMTNMSSVRSGVSVENTSRSFVPSIGNANKVAATASTENANTRILTSLSALSYWPFSNTIAVNTKSPTAT